MSEENIDRIDCRVCPPSLFEEHQKSGLVTVCKGCLELLENSAGRKINETRMNPFTCHICKKEGDGGIHISLSAAYGSKHDTGTMTNDITICDECFENKLPVLLEIADPESNWGTK